MSDIDHRDALDPALDHAFRVLARDLAHSHRPGAAAAVATVRRRRRRRMGGVALATLAVLAGGLALPQALTSEDDIAANGSAAPLDAAAMTRATEGWIEGWSDERRMSGSFTMPDCPALADADDATSRGDTVVFTDSSSAAVRMFGFDGKPAVDDAWDRRADALSTCQDLGAYEVVAVDGTSVLHWRTARPAAGAGLTDVFLARSGSRIGQLELVTPAPAASTKIVRRVSLALLAGVREGWTQSGMSDSAGTPTVKGPLPGWPDAELEEALAGWRSRLHAAAPSTPGTPCLDERLEDDALASSGGGEPRGITFHSAGFTDQTVASAKVAAMLRQLRGCTDADMHVERLPNGVHLATYDAGGRQGLGALWFAAEGDRAGFVGVEGADRPMPTEVRQGVADVLLSTLRLPWA